MIEVSAQEAYRLWSDAYDEGANPLLALEMRVLRDRIGPLAGCRVIDVAAGTGRWMAHASARGAAVIGIDLSPSMLSLAARKDALAGRLVVADMRSLPIAIDTAELAICSFGLGYVDSVRGAIAEMSRVARRVIVSDLHPDAVAAGWSRSFRSGADVYQIRSYSHALTELDEAAKSAGLRPQWEVEARFGDAEMPLFKAAGKEDRFPAAQMVPAMFARCWGKAVILAGARVAINGRTARRIDLEILNGTMRYGAGANSLTEAIDLSGFLLLPGLINAHDHLEFNLFPQLGRRIYNNAAEWAGDIHRPHESPLKEHLSIPLPVRLAWGGIRNLLSGVTTVAHHNPYEAAVFGRDFPVSVLRNFAWAHSLAFSPDLADRFRGATASRPFIIHAAEGTDATARCEIRQLEDLGVLTPQTVLVHAIGAESEDLKILQRRGTSIVWCPRSNLSTYGRTLSAETLRSGIRIALGTDSAITSQGDLIDEIRTAVSECGVSAEAVYRMVTSEAAGVLRLRSGEGALVDGGVADVLAVADTGQSPAEALLNLNPEFLMNGGRFKLLSEPMADGPLSGYGRGFQPIRIASRERCFIDADLGHLYGEAVKAIGPEVHLAGRFVGVGAA